MPSRDIAWISELEKFAIFLASEASIRARDRPVKIAIIDDGVDALQDIFRGKIATGRSFCPLGGSSDLMNAYYVPSGRHGTMMADLICRICPSCQLYVARLDEVTNRNDMSRQITVKSATEVSSSPPIQGWNLKLIHHSFFLSFQGYRVGRCLQSRHHLHELDHRRARRVPAGQRSR